MTKLEEITPDCSIAGIVPDGLVTVVAVNWNGTVALEA